MSHLGGNEFVEKLYSILEDSSNSPYIRWRYDGKGVLIVNPELVGEKVLVNYFKHGNLSTLIRQLNKYGFNKVKCSESSTNKHGGGVVEFVHKYFEAGRRDILHLIKRKKTINSRKSMESGQNNLRVFNQMIVMQNSALRVFENIMNNLYVLRENIKFIKQKAGKSFSMERSAWNAIILDYNSLNTSNVFYILKDLGFSPTIVKDENTLLHYISLKAYEVIVLSSYVKNILPFIKEIRSINSGVYIVITANHNVENYDKELYGYGNIKVIQTAYLKDLLLNEAKSLPIENMNI